MSDTKRDAFHERVIEELATLRAVSENILAQTTKTNGRVSSLEVRANGHDVLHAVDTNERKKEDWWKERIGTALFGILCSAIGFTVLLVLQKTDILNI